MKIEQNLYEIILKNFKEAVVFADAQGRIQIFNLMAEKYFQIAGKKVLAKRLERVIPYKNIKKHFDSVYEKRESNHDVELAIHVPLAPSSDQKTRILQCSFYPIFDKKGTIFLAVWPPSRISRRKGYSCERSARAGTFPPSECWRDGWLMRFRNPLSSLNINIELLREELGGEAQLCQREEIHSLINFISYETLRLENNLKEFLDFNRLPPLKFEWIQLNEVLDSVVRLLRQMPK